MLSNSNVQTLQLTGVIVFGAVMLILEGDWIHYFVYV